MSKKGLQGQFLTIMALLIFALLIASIGVSTSQKIQQLTDDKQSNAAYLKTSLSQKGRLLSNLTADLINSLSANIDQHSLNSKLKTLVDSDDDLKYAILMDKEHIAFVYTLQPVLQNKTLDDKLSQLLAIANESSSFEYSHQGDNYLEFITHLSTEKVSTLRLGFSLSAINTAAIHTNTRIKQAVRQAVLHSILLAILCLALAWYASRKLSHHITKPLQDLTHRVDSITSGNYLPSAESVSKNSREVTALNNALHRLSLRLYKSQHEFKEYGDNLEQQIEIRTIELAQAKNQADKCNTKKNEFLEKMSHEVRTPMNAMIGLTHLLNQTSLTHRQQDYTRKIIASGEALLTIINNILDFSKIESGMLTLEKNTFDLEEVLANVIPLVVHNAHEKGLELMIDLKPEVPTVLIGDAIRLQQILVNLLSNAIKHTQCGEITLSIDISENPSNQKISLRYSVTDSGSGMTDEQKTSLFETFTSPEMPVTSSYNHSGLGLTICKNLVQMMDGKIWVKSTYGIGSEFIFLARFGLPARSHQKKQLKFPANACSILLVDNHAHSSNIMISMLTQLGLKVTSVESTQHALDDISHASHTGQPYQLVIMKADMPQISGDEAALRIKTQLQLSKVPQIILISKTTDASDYTSLLGTTINTLLVAPVTASKLRSSITTLLTSPFKVPSPYSKEKTQVHALAGAHILVTEDNDINQQVIGELLSSIGIQVSFANNGQEAIDLLLNTTPIVIDGILMDLQMPKMDGYEATQRLRLDPRYQKLPIIGLTAHASTKERQQCLKAGMQEHLSKPINPEQLFSTLSRFISPHTKEPLNTNPAPSSKQDDTTVNIINDLQNASSSDSSFISAATRFLEQHLDTVKRISQALSQKQYHSAQQILGALHRAASTINITTLENSALILEDSIKQRQPDEQITVHLNHLSKTLQVSLQHVRETVHRLEAPLLTETKLAQAASNNTKSVRILVADDNSINLEILKELLLLIGYESELTNNGEEAWEKWQLGTYDLVLADIFMPIMDGYELTRRIRATETSNSHTPIIAFTSSSSKSDLNRCFDVGMNDLLTKPVTLSNLQKLLEKWLPKALLNSTQDTEETKQSEY